MYTMGPPIHCDVDMADLLREHVAELDEGCSSEDEMLLEAAAGEGDEDEDGEGEGDEGGTSWGDEGMKAESSRTALKRQHRDSTGTVSDLSDASSTSATQKRANHRSRYRSQHRKRQRAEEQQRTGQTSKAVARKHRAAAQPIVLPKANATSFPVNSTGFGGRRQTSFKPAASLESLKKR